MLFFIYILFLVLLVALPHFLIVLFCFTKLLSKSSSERCKTCFSAVFYLYFYSWYCLSHYHFFNGFNFLLIFFYFFCFTLNYKTLSIVIEFLLGQENHKQCLWFQKAYSYGHQKPPMLKYS